MDRKVLYKLFNGEASEKDKKNICEWFDENSENQSIMFKERRLFDLLLFAKEKDVRRSAKTIPLWRRQWIREIFKIAAILFLLAGVSIYFLMDRQDQFSKQFHTISVPAGQRTDIILADGTHIYLNSNSEIKYPVYFTGKERRVILKGEAFFDVKNNNSMPFIVETDNYSVKVLGTQFNVDAYMGREFTAALQEGKVCVFHNDNPLQFIILQPGQQVKAVNNKTYVEPIDNMDIFRWKEGLVCFENMTFEKLMDQFEKSYGVNIVIQKHPSHNKFSGKFRVSDGIDHAFRILQKNSDFSFSWNDERNTVYIR